MFEAGAQERLAELLMTEKQANWGTIGRGLAGFGRAATGEATDLGRSAINRVGSVASTANKAITGAAKSVYRQPGQNLDYVTGAMTKTPGAGPLRPWVRPAAMGAGAAGAGAVAGGLGTKHVMEGVFADEAQKAQTGFRSMISDYAGSQSFGDKLRDLLAYIFNGKALATNKYNDMLRYGAANQEKYFTPRMRSALQPTFNSAVKPS